MKPHEDVDLRFERLALESDEDENETEDTMSNINTDFFMLTKGVFQSPKKMNLYYPRFMVRRDHKTLKMGIQ